MCVCVCIVMCEISVLCGRWYLKSITWYQRLLSEHFRNVRPTVLDDHASHILHLADTLLLCKIFLSL